MIRNLSLKESNQELLEDYKKSDKFMLILIFIHWVLVSTLSAYAYNSFFFGFIGGGMLFLITLIAYRLYSGTAIFRIMIGIILMTYTIISIQQNLGRIEMHFHVFIALSFLTVYKDLVPATIASIYIIIHHLLFTYLQLNGILVFGTEIMVYNYGCGYDIALLHAFFVIFEWIILFKIISTNKKSFNEINLYKNQLKSSNKKLQKSVNNFQELFDLAGEAIIIFDENKNVVDLNISAQKMFGYTKEEFLGKNILDFVPKGELFKVRNAIKREMIMPYELNLYKKGGSIFPALAGGVDIIRDGKKYRMTTVQDLTYIKDKEKALLRSEKLASMGEMIGNIAHQWRQPLSVISTGATGIQLQKNYNTLTDEFLNETCEMIDKNAQYLSKTIDDFRNFIKGDSKSVRFDLKNDTDSFLKIIDATIKSHNIQVVLELRENIKVQGYPNELIQCFINIFNNAKDALLHNNEDNRYIFISELIDDEKISIKFKDNAGGIPQNIIDKVFDPYFTTKHKSQGTGLGLHMAYNLIIDGMGGTIEVKNVNFEYNGKNFTGAEFTICLPIS